VQQGSKGHFVWVVGKESKVEQRPVTVGEWHEDDWFIFEGLRAGEVVVVDGVLTLRPGATVSTKPYDAGQPSAAGQPQGAAAPTPPKADAGKKGE
jgi:membrane fusion protein, multidrug efflux system